MGDKASRARLPEVPRLTDHEGGARCRDDPSPEGGELSAKLIYDACGFLATAIRRTIPGGNGGKGGVYAPVPLSSFRDRSTLGKPGLFA
jgi:hypothetical protein